MAKPRDPGSATRGRAPLRLYATFLVGWSVASGLVVQSFAVDGTSDDRVFASLFVASTGVLVLAVINRDLVARRRAQLFLVERQGLIEAIGVVTDPRLRQLPIHLLLDELLHRTRTVLRADTASVFLVEAEHDQLRRTASSGLGPDASQIVVVPQGRGLIGGVAASREIAVFPDAPLDAAVPRGTASLVAAPLIAEGNVLGVLELGMTQRREFNENELRLLQLVADRTAIAIDGTRLEREAWKSSLAADAARRRLSLLADAGEVLARPFADVRSMAAALGDALVPEFADWFSFYDLDGDGRPRQLHAVAGPVLTRRTREIPWTDAVARALTAGTPDLVWGERLVREWPDARARDLTSVLVVPMATGSVTFGALVLGTGGRRRGLRPGDTSTGADLGARVAVTVERVRLSTETERSAERAARHAVQLQRLAEAAFAVNVALSERDLAGVVAEQAARVFEADGAWVELRDGRRQVRTAEFGTRPRGAISATAPLTDPDGETVGAVTVARARAELSAEDENVLRSLAQIASVALANARLYGTVQASEERMRALYDASPVGIVELDIAGSAARWNRAAEALFGWPAYVEGTTAAQPLPDAARDFVVHALREESSAAVDVTLGEMEAELVAVPLRERDGTVRGAVLAAVDLTERKHVAEQLQAAQRMEAMARMAGGIAHDFNNVLMVITGYADLLLRRSLDDDSREDLEAMRAAAKRAAEFTRKLLTISRRQLVQVQVIEVAAAVRSLADVLPVMLGKSVELDLHVGAPPAVLIDPAQLEQIVLNLALNGKDAMPDGGTLTIRADAYDDGDATWALLTVSDTGDGMDPETLEHCFEPFFTTKDRTKGTGIGLSTVHGAVSQAGGEITVESGHGSGTTFNVRLPAAGAAATAAIERPEGSGTGLLRVLVVDDDADVRAIVADMLELEGHVVRTAADGEEALARLDEADPDLLLTDVVMPGMRGTELAREVVARKPDVRVVLMSSHVDDEVALGDAALKGALFLSKPFSPDGLLEVLDAAARQPAQGSKR